MRTIRHRLPTAEEVNHFHILGNVLAMRPPARRRINMRSMIGTEKDCTVRPGPVRPHGLREIHEAAHLIFHRLDGFLGKWGRSMHCVVVLLAIDDDDVVPVVVEQRPGSFDHLRIVLFGKIVERPLTEDDVNAGKFLSEICG